MEYLNMPKGFLRPANHYSDTETHVNTDALYDLPFSRTTNAFLAGLFTVCLLLHFWQGIKCRSWGFLMLMAVGGLGEIIGYTSRSLQFDAPFSGGYMSIQLLALSLAPTFLGGGTFVVLKHILDIHAADSPRITPGIYSWVFAVSAIQGVFLQIFLLISASRNLHVTMAFIISQIVILSTLIMMLHSIFYIILKNEQNVSRWSNVEYTAEVSRLFIPLVVILTAFFIRGLYRMTDSTIGYNHTLIQIEALFVNLDGCMSLVVILGFNFFHPGRLLEIRSAIGLNLDLSTMEKQQWQQGK